MDLLKKIERYQDAKGVEKKALLNELVAMRETENMKYTKVNYPMYLKHVSGNTIIKINNVTSYAWVELKPDKGAMCFSVGSVDVSDKYELFERHMASKSYTQSTKEEFIAITERHQNLTRQLTVNVLKAS